MQNLFNLPYEKDLLQHCQTFGDIVALINTTDSNHPYITPEYIAVIHACEWAYNYIECEDEDDKVHLEEVTIDQFTELCGDPLSFIQHNGAEFDLNTAEEIIENNYIYWVAKKLNNYPNYKFDFKNNTEPSYLLSILQILRRDLDNNRIDMLYYTVQLIDILNDTKTPLTDIDGTYLVECLNISRKQFINEFVEVNNQLPALQIKYRQAKTTGDRARLGNELTLRGGSIENAARLVTLLNEFIV